jgi:RNA polymerase sigma-70 factor (ECF subfamily)
VLPFKPKSIVRMPGEKPRKPYLRLQPNLHEIYHREVAYVWTFLRRLGIRAVDLEDLTQEVFTKFFEGLGSYDPARPARPWLLGIAFRVALDFRRLARHRLEVITDPTQIALTRHASSDTPAPLLAIQRRDLILQALQDLPLERRGVFVMYELEGQPVAEIAAALQLPSNTIYSRLRVARAEFVAAILRLEELSDGAD